MRVALMTTLMFAASLAGASANPVQTPGSDVTVSKCDAKLGTDTTVTRSINTQGVMTTSETTPVGYSGPSLAITYTNAGSRAASEVDFALVGEHGVLQNVKDVAAIAPGATIDRSFKVTLTNPLGLDAAQCVVTKVVYTDGSIWTNPQPPQP